MDLCFFTLSVCILHTFGLRKNFTSPSTYVVLHCLYAYWIDLDLEKFSQVVLTIDLKSSEKST